MKISCSLSLLIALLFLEGAAHALEFPETCRTPSGVVDEIYGIDTEKATMQGKHTMPDIIFACHAGNVTQGTMSPKDCIDFYVAEGFSAGRLDAQANCQKGAITVDGNLTVFPIEPGCANAGFQAIKAFKILCPSSDMQLEK